MIRKGLRPGFRIEFGGAGGQDAYRRSFPFRRSWPLIVVLAVFDAIFLFPAISTFGQLSGFGNMESLFDVVGFLFLSAWLLGWSLAPLALTTLLLVLLFGRETISVRSGVMQQTIGLPFLGVAMDWDVSRMRNLRVVEPPPKSPLSWRGKHFAFDYGANSGQIGSDVDPMELGALKSEIQMGSGISIRTGEATEEELAEKWEAVPEEPEIQQLSEPSVAEAPASLASTSTLALIAANLVPLIGAVFFGWKLADVMVLYWAESAVIGLFNVAKMIKVGGMLGIPASIFFAGHFGAFMAVHFLFLYTIFVEGFSGEGPSGEMSEVFAMFASLWPALLALVLSHGISFFQNFLGRKEYQGRTIAKQMNEPYSRIVFMHLVLIFGGGLAMVLGEPTIVILAVIGIKIFIDIRAHLKQRSAGDAK